MAEHVLFKDLKKIDFKEAWDYQYSVRKKMIDIKILNRNRAENEKEAQIHHLLFCEHFPVYTLGKSGREHNLLLDQKQLEEQGFRYYRINRGGDITYHGPGQIVIYPIFDLDLFFTDVHKYVRLLEQIVIDLLDEYGLHAIRVKGLTGVWFSNGNGSVKRKISAIGVHLSRWVTMHGLALNVNTNLSHFDNIIPCGIGDEDKIVTSMSKELGYMINLSGVKEKLKANFARHFGFEFIN